MSRLRLTRVVGRSLRTGQPCKKRLAERTSLEEHLLLLAGESTELGHRVHAGLPPTREPFCQSHAVCLSCLGQPKRHGEHLPATLD